MPKIGEQQSNLSLSRPSPFEHIEAPSTASLDNGRLREELFHLERAISDSKRYNQETVDALDELSASVDSLKETLLSVEDTFKTLTETIKKQFEFSQFLDGKI